MRLYPTSPPRSYPYWMCDGEELYLNECTRYARTSEDLIEIPAEGGEGRITLGNGHQPLSN